MGALYLDLRNRLIAGTPPALPGGAGLLLSAVPYETPQQAGTIVAQRLANRQPS